MPQQTPQKAGIEESGLSDFVSVEEKGKPAEMGNIRVSDVPRWIH